MRSAILAAISSGSERNYCLKQRLDERRFFLDRPKVHVPRELQFDKIRISGDNEEDEIEIDRLLLRLFTEDEDCVVKMIENLLDAIFCQENTNEFGDPLIGFDKVSALTMVIVISIEDELAMATTMRRILL